MKWSILLLFISFYANARPVVLVSYYDSFDGAKFNNSEKVAKLLFASNKNETLFEIKLCPLNTVFDRSYAQLEDCLKSLDTLPLMVLELGETGCQMKLEMVARNLDKTKGPDNDGNERNNTPIIPEGTKYLGLTLPLVAMYCGLTEADRNLIEISNNAGSFVCNNTAYQMSYHYREVANGLIHVPSHKCSNLDMKNKMALKSLKEMITTGIKHLNNDPLLSRAPVEKKEFEALRKITARGKDRCPYEFFKRARGVDELDFWSFLTIK